MLYHDNTNTYRDGGRYIEKVLEEAEADNEYTIIPKLVKKIILTEKAKMYLSQQKDYIRAFKSLREEIDYVIEFERVVQNQDKYECKYEWKKTMGKLYGKK